MRKISLEEFIKRAKEIHGDKYDYSEVDYINKRTKVCIICPDHGEFWQTPDSHIYNRNGCSDCAGNKKLTFEEFVIKANKKHNNKFTYPLNTDFDNNEYVSILCPNHGLFSQKAYSHLYGKGCNNCAIEARTHTRDEFINKAKKVHDNLYTYDDVKYINATAHVEITCKKHGNFSQNPSAHLLGRGCIKCFKTASKLEKEVLGFVKSVIPYNVIQGDRSLLGGNLELDILIPDLKLAIEVNGDYWHYTKQGGNRNHSLKSKTCKEKGYILFHLRESLWNNNKDKMKKVIEKLIQISNGIVYTNKSI